MNFEQFLIEEEASKHKLRTSCALLTLTFNNHVTELITSLDYTYKKGDIIRDSLGFIEITGFSLRKTFFESWDEVYFGYELKKDKTRKKNKKMRRIYLSNIKGESK